MMRTLIQSNLLKTMSIMMNLRRSNKMNSRRKSPNTARSTKRTRKSIRRNTKSPSMKAKRRKPNVTRNIREVTKIREAMIVTMKKMKMVMRMTITREMISSLMRLMRMKKRPNTPISIILTSPSLMIRRKSSRKRSKSHRERCLVKKKVKKERKEWQMKVKRNRRRRENQPKEVKVMKRN